jgi:hypothetical protein
VAEAADRAVNRVGCSVGPILCLWQRPSERGRVKIEWAIDEDEARRVSAFVESQSTRSFVQYRASKNITGPPPSFSRPLFWHGMLACLLTTQQRSGPHSAVTRLVSAEPFPLALAVCQGQEDVEGFVAQTITGFGGLRRANRIGNAAAANLAWLSGGGWGMIEAKAAALAACRARPPKRGDRRLERTAARLVMQHMREFGPKQSRNLWQCLGLTRYEIPLDSRITKWLNANGFPVQLSATPLADTRYYEFVMDGVQAICEACGVLPCVLDAAIFASYDEEWPEGTRIW